MDEKSNFSAVFTEKLVKNNGLEAMQAYEGFINNPNNEFVVNNYISFLKMVFKQVSLQSQKEFMELLDDRAKIGEISQEELQEFKKFFLSKDYSLPPEALKKYLPVLVNSNQEIKDQVSLLMPGLPDPFSSSLPEPILQLHSLGEQCFTTQKAALEETLRDPAIKKLNQDTQEKMKRDVTQVLKDVNKINEQPDSRYYLYHSENGLFSTSYASYSEAVEIADESYRIEQILREESSPGASLPSGQVYVIEVSEDQKMDPEAEALLDRFMNKIFGKPEPLFRKVLSEKEAERNEKGLGEKKSSWPPFLRTFQQIKTVVNGELSEEKHRIQINPNYQGILIERAIKQIHSLIDRLENNSFLKWMDTIKKTFGLSTETTTEKKISYLRDLEDSLKIESQKPIDKQRTVAGVLSDWSEANEEKMAVISKKRSFSIFSKTHTAEVLEQIQRESELQNLSSSGFISYQKGLPTFADVKADQTDYYSDHLPFLSELPLKPGEKPLKVLSWNMEFGDSSSGFADGGPDKNVDRIGETSEEIIERFAKNLSAVEMIAAKQQPDVICLQEAPSAVESGVNQGKFKIEQLDGTHVMLEAPKGYRLMKSQQGGSGRATLFSENFLKKYEVAYDKDTDSWKCTSKDNREVIYIHNEHIPWNSNLVKIEKEIQQKLEKGLPESNAEISYTRLAVGDFNGFEIPAHNDKPQNLTEGVVGGMCTKGQIQGSDSVTGGYVGTKTKDGTRVSQLPRMLVNPENGELMQDNPPIDVFKMPLSQREEVTRVRPALCIDNAYKTRKVINGQTIFEYEKMLRDNLEMKPPPELGSNPTYAQKEKYSQALDKLLFVRMGSDMNNERHLVITLPEHNENCINFFKGLEDSLSKEKDILFGQKEDWVRTKDNPRVGNYQISVPLDKVERFNEAVEQYFNPQLTDTAKLGA